MDAYIYDGVRTPRGSLRDDGGLTGTPALTMLGILMSALGARTEALSSVEDLTLGCVTQKGEQGGNIARTALITNGYPSSAAGIMLNSFCCSGLDACQGAALKSNAGMDGLHLAGGVESMSRVAPFSDKGPYYSDPAVMQKAAFSPMWLAADFVATRYGISREAADAYAAMSQQRAAAAQAEGRFEPSLIAVPDALDHDENTRPKTTAAALAALPTFHDKMGTREADAAFLSAYHDRSSVNHIHHAGSAPALADAASLVLIGSKAAGKRAGLTPRARIRSALSTAADPLLSLTGGIEAAKRAIEGAGMTAENIDLFEFNEAYAAVCLLFQREMDIVPERMNVNGGAIALGHPMGATGGILLLTLLDELERQGKSTGCIAVSGAAGLGSAMIIERI